MPSDRFTFVHFMGVPVRIQDGIAWWDVDPTPRVELDGTLYREVLKQRAAAEARAKELAYHRWFDAAWRRAHYKPWVPR